MHQNGLHIDICAPLHKPLRVVSTLIVARIIFLCLACLASHLVFASPLVELNEAEKQWLEDNPSVTFTGDPNWLPFEAFTDTGEYIGIVSDHLKIISEQTGLKFEMSPSDTWTESTLKAKQGEVAILSETDDSDLKSHLHFTVPYLSNPIVIAMDLSENHVENLEHISHKRIALIKDYGYASKIRRKYNHIEFVTVSDIQDGLISVSTGKIDALLCTLALCSYTIHELGISDVKITGITEFSTELALGVQKDMPELVSILNKAIKNISQGEQQLITDAWIKHEYVEKVDYTIAILITVVAMVLISIFIMANRRLSRAILLREEAEKKLKATIDYNERYRILFYESAVGHAVTRLSTGEFLSVNNCFADITGYKLEELNTLSYWDLTPESYAKEEEEQLQSLHATNCYGPYEKHYIHKKGHLVAVRLNGSIVISPSGEQQVLSVVEDISAFTEAKEKLRLSSLVLENSSEAMLITDASNKIIAANPAYTKITGYVLDEIKGKDPGVFKSGKHDKKFYNEMWKTLIECGQWQGEIWDKRKNNEVYAKWLTIDTIRDKSGDIYRYVALFSDITEKKLSEEIIWKQANFDTVTGLPNRNYFYSHLQKEMNRCLAGGDSLALFLLDLDRFKDVNDTLGHDMGDLLLKLAGDRIPECIQRANSIARLGGDEFTIILPGVSTAEEAMPIAQKLITLLAEPYQLNIEAAHISASIGITFFPRDASTIEALIKNADQAMYAAKNAGRNRYSYFTQALQEQAQKRLRLSNDLRTALKEQEFQVFFQPIVDLRSGVILKAEALLRWFHPVRGMIPPLEFIPIAEDIGIIAEIGDWVCEQSSQFSLRLKERFNTHLKISVNMSPVQFKGDLRQFGNKWLNTHNKQNQNLIIEITEGLLLNADPEVLEKLYHLRDCGFEVAIDDFGTGYSSLSYLKKFDIDYLKIDQSFTKNLESDANDRALSEAIIVMAHKLDLKVIAEGVETDGQRAILSKAGCDFGQGYLYSKPLPADEFESYIKQFYIEEKRV